MRVGETVNEDPAPSGTPPHIPEYQYQSDKVPKVPPVIPKVVEFPVQIVVVLAVAEVAEVELSFTEIVTFTHKVELHAPSALT